MWNLLLRLIVTMLALKGADYFVTGFQIHGGWKQLALFAIVLGVLNWLIKPILVFFSFPFLILTVGLFYLVINALILYIATVLMPNAVSATAGGIFFGSLLLSIFHWFLSILFRVKKKEND